MPRKKGKVPPSKVIEYLPTDRPIITCGDGPWRKDPRVENADPKEQMAALQKGDVRENALTPPSADETAEQRLTLMARAG